MTLTSPAACGADPACAEGVVPDRKRATVPEGVNYLCLCLCLSRSLSLSLPLHLPLFSSHTHPPPPPRFFDDTHRQGLYSWMDTHFATSVSLTGAGFSERATLKCDSDIGRNRVKREVAQLEKHLASESGVVDAVPDEEGEERGLAVGLDRIEQRLVEAAALRDEHHDQGAPLLRQGG